MQPTILIHGPTASGKSELAVRLAEMLEGEVVNADSMQVYEGLSVLTARPSPEEMGGVPHHLFGFVDPAERYSTGRWLKAASGKIEDIRRKGRVPIVVGGTGLYFLSLIKGLSTIPPIPEDVRADVKQRVARDGVARLHEELRVVDPISAERLKPGDRVRVMRAFEVWLATGQTIASFQADPGRPELERGEWLGLALTPPRTRLYKRIDKRFGAMMVAGAMEEVKAMASRDLDPDLPAMKAHGMPWLLAYLRGEMSSQDAAELAQRDTRRYAKRQFTWIANQFPFWPRIPSFETDRRIKVALALYRDLCATR